MTQSSVIPVQEGPALSGRRLVVCGWCDSTHLAEVSCICKEPCSRGWCPAAVEPGSPFVPCK